MSHFTDSGGSSSTTSGPDEMNRSTSEVLPLHLATDDQVANAFAKQFGMSPTQKEMLKREIETCLDDPVLIIWINPNWSNLHGLQATNTILDFIATWDRPTGPRRDINAPGLLYHFVDFAEISRCRLDLLAQFEAAFAFTPAMITRLQQTLNLNQAATRALNDKPFARVGIVNRVSLQSNDGYE